MTCLSSLAWTKVREEKGEERRGVSIALARSKPPRRLSSGRRLLYYRLRREGRDMRRHDGKLDSLKTDVLVLSHACLNFCHSNNELWRQRQLMASSLRHLSDLSLSLLRVARGILIDMRRQFALC